MLKSIAILGMIAVGAGEIHALTLDEYLSQVEKESLAYKGNQARAEGAGLVASEADLITSPLFFASGRKSFDGKRSSPPVMVFDQIKSDNLSLGVSQQFNFGLKANFSYSLLQTEYVGANFGAGIPTRYWDLSPKVDLVMPLWANGFGRDVEAKQVVARKQNLADQYANLAQSKNLLVEAEVSYWRLSSAQERVQIQESALKAGKSILEYVEGKKRKNLGEAADVLQAKALVEAYQLQLQLANNEKQSAERAFNTFINLAADATTPVLDSLNYSALEKIEIPDARPGERLDVQATKAQADLARATSELIVERNKPTLDLMGGYALNGRGPDTASAFENANKATRDAGYVGVLFQIPLNFKATADARAGARRLKDSAEINVKNITFKQEQDWLDLKQKLSESKATLKLARAMESAQKSKLENERQRLRQGRTTTYQVLLFEQDFTSAQSSRVESAKQIVALQSQLKYYQTTPMGEK